MNASKWKVEALGCEDRRFVDQYLAAHDGHFLAELAAQLAQRGISIGRDALRAYSIRMREKRGARELR
jgi:hypothetical protein